MQNEGAQEAVCEDGVREVERLMKMMRESPKCKTGTSVNDGWVGSPPPNLFSGHQLRRPG